MIDLQTGFFALVPAAGSGSRFGAPSPKQYLPLLGRPLLAHTLDALLAVPRLARVAVVIAPDDELWASFSWPADPRLLVLRCGGGSRAESVAAGLECLAGEAGGEDWVLVHDAARPCLTPQSVTRMIETLESDPVGGLLAVPVADTLKRADGEGRVAATVARDGLWQAQTPQMFRFDLLRRALAQAQGVTDEAGAIEAMGLKPLLVPGDASNFKVTYPQDLALAERILLAREKGTQ